MATTKPAAKTAAKPAPVKAVKPSASREVANWDEELAKQAQEAAKTEESTATGSFFSMKSGVLALNDSPMEGNQIAGVITDAILENVFYGSDYDPDDPKGPLCFAFGRSEEEMKPHKACVDAGTAVSESCEGCPNNEWGSADKGRGKACRNIRRLGIVAAGKIDKNDVFEGDFDNIESQPIVFMKLPVTSVKGYSAYVKSAAATLKRPPHGVITRIKVVPDAKSQFKVTFDALGLVPNKAMGHVMALHAESKATIEQPYSVGEDEDEKPARGAKGKAAPAKGKAAPAKGKPAASRRKY